MNINLKKWIISSTVQGVALHAAETDITQAMRKKIGAIVMEKNVKNQLQRQKIKEACSEES
jgi:hypothetical protein